MAHILTIIPKEFRVSKKVQTLSCMKDEVKNIQQRINCAAKVKQQIEEDIFERNNKIKQNSDAAIII